MEKIKIVVDERIPEKHINKEENNFNSNGNPNTSEIENEKIKVVHVLYDNIEQEKVPPKSKKATSVKEENEKAKTIEEIKINRRYWSNISKETIQIYENNDK